MDRSDLPEACSYWALDDFTLVTKGIDCFKVLLSALNVTFESVIWGLPIDLICFIPTSDSVVQVTAFACRHCKNALNGGSQFRKRLRIVLRSSSVYILFHFWVTKEKSHEDPSAKESSTKNQLKHACGFEFVVGGIGWIVTYTRID